MGLNIIKKDAHYSPFQETLLEKRNKGKFEINIWSKGKPKILKGEFVFLLWKDSTQYVKEVYADGHPKYFITVQNECISEYIDYTIRYKNEIGSLYYEYCSCSSDQCEAYLSYWTGKKWKYEKIDTYLRSEQMKRANYLKLPVNAKSTF